MVASVSSKCTPLTLAVLACLAADKYRPAPRFEGKSIPDPPRQGEPWTPPETKLPKFLVSATAALFEQGMADPRGCEYREVEVGEGGILQTRGFVLPERAGEAGRFVVRWDGVVSPALSVGAAIDLDEDVRTLAESMKRDREAATARNTNRTGGAGGFTGATAYGGMWGGRGPSSVEDRSPLKLCLLLRLGRADLAEALFASGTTWTPEVRGRDLTHYRISYVTLAADWAASVFLRLVAAHVRGDDAIALDAARRLSSFAKAAEAKADAMGFPRVERRFDDKAPSYFPFLRQLPELLADHERRAKEPARGPIPKPGGDPSARIAALIRDFDQIDERQMMSPGAAHPGDSPLVRELIAEGDPAVEPLLTALEADMRLTRSVSNGRGMSIDRTVHPVYEAEIHALVGILETAEFHNWRERLRGDGLAGRKELVRSIRAFWEKNRTISLTDRWYRTLRDDTAGRDRWLEAAGGIVQAREDPAPPGLVGLGVARPRKPNPPPMKGEELRSKRDPSVSELLARRASEIARSGNPLSIPDRGLHHACQLAVLLHRWDDKAALPVLRTLMARCLEGIEHDRKQGRQADRGLAGFMAQFTVLRAGAGEREALDEYAAWARGARPEEMESQALARFEPMWIYPDHPAIAEAARGLFNDPKSPWASMLRAPHGRAMSSFAYRSLYTSPLVCVAGFRAGVIAALADKSEIGTVGRGDRGSFLYKLRDGGSVGFSSYKADLEAVEPGVELPFRVCDFISWQVSSLDGAPECELYWPEDRRDRAVAACAAFLERYGDRFTADAPAGERDFPEKKAHLAFPAPGRPATRADVRETRAIFSLEGQGDVRVADVPELPIRARWVTLEDVPLDRPKGDGTFRREYDQAGWIWQAEEVRRGDRWERSYGFVGRHVIARVPAAEIESGGNDSYSQRAPFPGGLDAVLGPVEPPGRGYEPGRPILVAVHIRNRRGVEHEAPTEFLRPGDDGRPSLRRGVTLAAFYSPPNPNASRSGQGRGGPGEELKPKRTDRFEPGDASRPLAAFRAFEAMRIDLNDWIDLTRPGSYRVRVAFAADSGVGQGTTNDWYFTVGDREGPLPPR